jgi:hypothetical protein
LEKYGRYKQRVDKHNKENIKCSFDLKKGEMDDDDIMVIHTNHTKLILDIFQMLCRDGDKGWEKKSWIFDMDIDMFPRRHGSMRWTFLCIFWCHGLVTIV